MKRESEQARLYLNDEYVGDIDVQGSDTAWTFGVFNPHEAFSKYAPHFGRWSMLMHEDEHRRVDRDLSQELRAAEIEIDRIAAKLFYVGKNHWRKIMQLNIDGSLIEWKQSSTVLKR